MSVMEEDHCQRQLNAAQVWLQQSPSLSCSLLRILALQCHTQGSQELELPSRC